MGIKCPKCHFENPDDTFYCGKCSTPLAYKEASLISDTETLELPKDRLTPGSLFAGRYQIIEELGKGGMGKVYRVLDQKLNEEVALKVLKPEIALDKKTLDRFSNELKLARRIIHKNVGRMYELMEHEGIHFITMEYVRGEDLQSFIKRSRQLAIGTAVTISKQVCQGLSEAHKLGVIHRDLKPSNIMIDREGNVRVMDFGVARFLQSKDITDTGVLIGTPKYMSPEQVEGKKTDQRSDIYSLGIILYEMVAGRAPFEGETPISLALKHKIEPPRDPRTLQSQVPEDLSRLILKCLEKVEGKRYQSAEEVLSELNKIEKGIPITEQKIPRKKPITSKEITITVGLKRVIVPVFILIALMIISFVILRFILKKEAYLDLSGKSSLAIMYFKNNTGDESLDHWRTALSDLLIADLSQSKYIRILSGASLFNILNQLNQLEVKSFSSEVLKEVGSRGKVNYVLVGDYAKAGDSFRINAMIQDTMTAELIGSERVEGTGQESFFFMVDELTRKIKTHFQLSSGEIASDIDESIKKITTSSPEAYKNYNEGLQYYRKGVYRRCIEFMDMAVAIDPEFAMAYRTMAYAYGTLGYSDEQKKYLQKALELKDRISERERYLIEGDFYRHRERTAGLAIEAYTKLLKLYPDEWRGNINLGILYHDLEEWDKAIERFEMNMQSQTETYFASLYLAQSYAALGRYDKAKDVLEYYLSNFSDNAIVHWYLARNYVYEGKYDLALVEADKASSLYPSMYQNFILKGDIYHLKGDLKKSEEEYRKLLEKEEQAAHMYGKLSLAALYLLQGRFNDLIKQLKQANGIAKNLGEKSTEFNLLRYLASMYIKSGKPEESLSVLEEAWKIASKTNDLTQQKSCFYDKAFILLEMNRIEEAAKAAEELKRMIVEGINQKEMRYYNYLIGVVELKKMNFSNAIKHFKKALSLIPSQYAVNNEHALFIEGLASAYFKGEDMEKAQREYENIVSLTISRLYYGDVFAKSFYMLGKIYERKGWEGKAIEHFEKFLDLSKEADPVIAEVEDAKKRLVGLKQKKKF